MTNSELTLALRVLKTGKANSTSGIKIQCLKSTYGCAGCIFQKEEGAIDCRLRKACMAHLRPDKKSVIFKEVNYVK